MSGAEIILTNATTIDRHGVEHNAQALVIEKECFVWCGAMAELPAHYQQTAETIEDCQGRLVTPGLIDCHTHLVYAGDRAQEFKLRLDGVSYAELAKRGGGILSTVKSTRQATATDLFDQALPRMLSLRAEGVTTVEIKSGYGLDLASELKLLQVARQLGAVSGMRVFTTFLGAHAIPPEFHGNSQGYVDYLCLEMIPAIAQSGLADAMDVFCETIAFSLQQTKQLFDCAKQQGLAIKCHAEQLSNLGASILAAQYGALSCDHLEYLDLAGIHAMAAANTTAVLLPGAFYFLRETQKPPIDLLRQANVPIAIATDCNPGSSPTTSLRLVMNLACQFFSMTVAEVLSGVTYNAARALGLESITGELVEGKAADLCRWAIQDSALLSYYFGYPLPVEVMIGGKWVK